VQQKVAPGQCPLTGWPSFDCVGCLSLANLSPTGGTRGRVSGCFCTNSGWPPPRCPLHRPRSLNPEGDRATIPPFSPVSEKRARRTTVSNSSSTQRTSAPKSSRAMCHTISPTRAGARGDSIFTYRVLAGGSLWWPRGQSLHPRHSASSAQYISSWTCKRSRIRQHHRPAGPGDLLHEGSHPRPDLGQRADIFIDSQFGRGSLSVHPEELLNVPSVGTIDNPYSASTAPCGRPTAPPPHKPPPAHYTPSPA